MNLRDGHKFLSNHEFYAQLKKGLQQVCVHLKIVFFKLHYGFMCLHIFVCH